MFNKVFNSKSTIFLTCIMALLATMAQGKISQKTLKSMVVPDQGILPGSRITEVMQLEITETDTSTADNPVDDGAATMESMVVSFAKLIRTSLDELDTVSLYEIGQDIEADDFDFQKDFSFSQNLLIKRLPVGSTTLNFTDLNVEILNTKKIFFIAITTDVDLDDDDEFSIVVSNIVLSHPAAADPKPNLSSRSEVLTCVDFAGDLMPVEDFIRSDDRERDYSFAPHNYTDFSYRHPDALNNLEDLEIPAVVPAESTHTTILGIEMAGVRSELQSIVLNFTSSIDGVNNDHDFFVDEPGWGVQGVFDPFIDEIILDNDGDGIYSLGDEVLYPGINGIIDAEMAGFDDDGDGLIDEEKLNLFRLAGDGFEMSEVNGDRDYFYDENGTGRDEAGEDEFYRDHDDDSRYAGAADADIILHLEERSPPSGAEFGTLTEGATLAAFPTSSTMTFTDRNGNWEFDYLEEYLLFDEDENGLVLVLPDVVIDLDGAISTEVGDKFFQEIKIGGTANPLLESDFIFTDSLVNPTIVWRDNAPFDSSPDVNDQILRSAPGELPSSTDTTLYLNVGTAAPQTWYYHDRDFDDEYEGGEDIFINVDLTQPEFNDASEEESIIYMPAGAAPLINGETLVSAAKDPLLTFQNLNVGAAYDPGEPIVLESFAGRTFTIRTENLKPGTDGVYSLTPGTHYPTSTAPVGLLYALIDEDHGYTVLQEIVDEDLQDIIAWFDDDGSGDFTMVDVDNDGDFFPLNEDINGNGVLDRFDNNNDGDYDDQDDYTEDLNGDGNLDLGISGDEIYIDYDGDGRFDPNVGGQLDRVSEMFFAGDDPIVQMRPSQAYPVLLSLDEDGDGERGGATMDSRLGVAMGLFPNREPFMSIDVATTVGINIPLADGLDNDGDGVVDNGINEDPGDSAFDAFTLYNAFDKDFSDDILVSDIERILVYKDNPDNPDGVFNANEDILVSRHDPDERSWFWLDTNAPVYTAVVNISVTGANDEEKRKRRQLPVTDNDTFDYFIVIQTDGDDDGDVFDDFGGVKLTDGLGIRHGDDFQVSLARDGIITDGGKPNAKQITKPIESILHMDDMIGFVSSTVQGEEEGNDAFIGNPYFDATRSPIAVLGMDIANSPIPKGDGSFENDVIEQVRVFIQALTSDEVTREDIDGTFNIVNNSGVITLPDLMGLADDSSGGIGIYRDDDTPQGDGVDDDEDGLIDEERLNGVDDDGDGKIDEDVGDDDPAGTPGVFDEYDDPLLLRNDTGSPLSYRLVPGSTDTVFVDLNLISGSEALPEDLLDYSRGYDYYVVLRTSDTIDYRDTFRVYVEDQGVRFRSGRSTMNTGVDTDSIAANVPIILSDLSLTDPGMDVQTIKANSAPTAVVGLNLHDSNLTDSGLPASLEYIRITFDNLGEDHDFTPSDLLPVSTVEDLNGNGVLDIDEFDWNGDGVANSGYDSGVALYRDSTDPDGKPGVFDDTDELVFLDGDETFGNLFGFPNTIQLNLDRWGDEDGTQFERIPADDDGDNEGNDYFVVIRTSSAISNGDDFRVRVSPVSANNVVQWPLHFRPRETNGIFEYTYSYEAIQTKTLLGNTQTDAVFSALVAIGEQIEAESDPTAVLGININDSGNMPARRLNQVKVRIYPGEADNTADDITSGFEISDLNEFSNLVNSGLAIYTDVDAATSAGNGIFEPGFDQRLNQTVSSFEPVFDGLNNLLYVDALINLSPGAEIPDDEMAQNVGNDFFIVVRTSRSISLNDYFSVQIPKDGLRFESGESFGNRAITTEVITAKVPVFYSDRTNVYSKRVGTFSEPKVAIGIDMNSGTQASPSISNQSMISMTVQFNRENDSTFTNIDIADLLSNSEDSGLSVYRDLPGSDATGNGRFNADGDQKDIYIPLAQSPVYVGSNQVMLVFQQSALTEVPPTDAADDFGADYFIVFRTSGSITRDSEFSVTVNGIQFENLNSEKSFTTDVITGEDVNQPPAIALLTPTLGDRASSETFAVLWEDSDDGQAKIDLYYIDEATFLSMEIRTIEDILAIPLEQLTPLADASGGFALDLPFDPSDAQNAFEWDVTRVSIGDKRVIAIITDEKQLRSADTSPGAVTITNELPTFSFEEPNGTNDQVVQGTPFFITWVDSDPENNANIELYLQTEVDGQTVRLDLPGAQNLFEDPDGEDDTYEVATSNIAAGTYFPVAKITDGVIRGGTEAPVLTVKSPLAFVVIENIAPEFTFVTPTEDQSLVIENGDFFDIQWTDIDNDSNATIALFFSPGNESQKNIIAIEQTNEIAGSIVFATGIPEGTGIEGEPEAEDTPNSFQWNISDVTPDTYYLFAFIDDGVNPRVGRFSEFTLTIDKLPSFTFIEPDGVGDSLIEGASYELIWEASDKDSVADIELFLITSLPVGATAPLVLGDAFARVTEKDGQDSLDVSTKGLAPGDYYPVARISDENNSPITVISQGAINVRKNMVPELTFLTPTMEQSQSVFNEDKFTIEWTDEDEDDNAVITLYYVPESARNVPGAKTAIAVVEEDDPDIQSWDVSTLAPDVYFLFATIDDKVNTAVSVFSDYTITIDKLPSFEFVEPDGVSDSVIRGATYTLLWNAQDSDSDATIDLYLTSNPPGDGTVPSDASDLLVEGLSENDDSEFVVVTAGLEPGNYFPVARIQDEHNDAIVVESAKPITILENTLPIVRLLKPPPTGVVAFGDSFDIRWVDANSEADAGDPAFVNLFYDTDDRELNGVLINPAPIRQDNEADSFTWDLAEANLPAGTYYLYATIEDTAQRIVFDYSDGPLVIPESGTNFFYGIHMLSSTGEVTSLDTSLERTFNVDFGFSDAVNAEANLDGTVLLAVGADGEVKAAQGGNVLSITEQEALGFEDFISYLPELPIGDRQVIDIEFDVNGLGYYLLDNYGKLYSSNSVINPLSTPGANGLFGFDIARDLEVTTSANGAYILTGDGGVVPLGDAQTISTPYFGWDIARDIEIVQGGYYILDTFGGIYAVGDGVASFDSTPYYSQINVAQDVEAISDGGYFILFDGGKMALGSSRLNLPSTATTTPVFDTGRTDLTDLALSGDIFVLFSEDLIKRSVMLFEAAFRAGDLDGIWQELSEDYDDGISRSRTTKLLKFQEFFDSPFSEFEQFATLLGDVVLSSDGQSATVIGETLLISKTIDFVTQSAELERNAIPNESSFNDPVWLIGTRNTIEAALSFELSSDQSVTFTRHGDGELFYLYLDVRKGEFGQWESVTEFALNSTSNKVLQLEGACDESCAYRVVVVDRSTELSNITQPLFIVFSYSETTETQSDYEVIYEYTQQAPGDWKITDVNLPPE